MSRGRNPRTGAIVKTLALGGALALVGGLLLGCPEAPEPQPGVTDVAMRNIAFDPAEVTIKKGESVRWTNLDLVPHTSTSGNPEDADAGTVWDSPQLGRAQSFTRRFDEAGAFVYFCRVHPTMMRDAKVTVVE